MPSPAQPHGVAQPPPVADLVDPAHPPDRPQGLRWDVFCRVIDNHGDLGVCWRLCAQLAAAGEQVRLWCDDASALEWMAGRDAASVQVGVQVLPWREPQADDDEPGDVVIEAFGCDPPPGFIARMAARPQAPVWINLEYLSAEAYVERSHALASPQFAGPGAGLTKWFFYPGFTPATGGLLREAGMGPVLQGVDRDSFLHALGAAPRADEQVVSLFAYRAEPLGGLLARLAPRPVLLLCSPGVAGEAASRTCAAHPHVRSHALPWLTQPDYDHLLRACDLNLVRGEDSFVRALWAGQPFLWQIYAQSDGVHAHKLAAFMARFVEGASPALQAPLINAFQAWNGLADWGAQWPGTAVWRPHCVAWRDALSRQTDLLTRLRRFVGDRLPAGHI